MSTMITSAPLHDPASALTDYRDEGFASMSDHEIVAWAARHLSVPREAAADSFVLHAPLELAARAALLPFVAPADRDLARVRLLTLTRGYERWGPAFTGPPPRDHPSVAVAAEALVDALGRGELDDVDAAAAWLGVHAHPTELRARLTGAVLPHLGAAAHGSIFLYHLPRVSPRGEVTGELLRGLARDLGRYPDWQLHWMDDVGEDREGPTASVDEVFDSLASTPNAAELDVFFIFPMMSFVDERGIAARQLEPLRRVAPADRAEVGRAILRVAAWSMLLEDDEAAPYGWSHCLTLPQAVLGIAGSAPDPLTALQIAGTHVVGFRAAQGKAPIDPTPPAEPGVPWREALDADRATAAAAVWHAPAVDRREVVSRLASRASTQHDAHLVKYTLACIDAAADDPAHTPLFLAAAASLGAYWHAHGNPDDPLA